MPRFAANLSTLYQALPFLDRIGAAAADGFDAVECQLPYEVTAPALADALQAAGLPMVLFNAPAGGTDAASIAQAWRDGARGVAALPGHEAEFQAGFALALEYAQALRCPRVHVMAGRLPASAHAEQLHLARATYIRNLRWAAQQAQAVGVDVLIEPINGRDMPDYLLQYQAEAHAVIDAVGEPNVLLQLDLYHCQIMEGDLSAHLQRGFAQQRIGHLQLAGVPLRHEPDEGEVNYPHLFTLIDQLQHRDALQAHTLGTARAPSRWSGHIGCEYRPARGDGPDSTSAGLGWLRQWRAQANR